MKKLVIYQVLLLAFFMTNANAQTTDQNFKKEIGIRMNGLSDFDFIFKKQKAENKYRRMRLISANFSIPDFEDFTSSFGLGVTYGKEKRKPLNDNLSLINGWELIGRFGVNMSEEDLSFTFTPGIGYVLGFQYEINNKFIVNLETIPTLTTTINYAADELSISNLKFGFNSNNIALGIMYKF